MFKAMIELWSGGSNRTRAMTAAELARRASTPLRNLFLKVAHSDRDPFVIDFERLDDWLIDHEGLAAARFALASEIRPMQVWTPQGGALRNCRVWRLQEISQLGPNAPEPGHDRLLLSPRADRSGLTLSEKLEQNASAALDVHADVLALGVDPGNMKQTRIVAEAASTTIKAKLHADVTSMQARKPDIGARILAIIEEQQEKIREIPAYPGYEPPPPQTPRRPPGGR